MKRTTSLPSVRNFCTSRRRQGPKLSLHEAPREHSCGIPTWKPPVAPPPPRVDLAQFPANLVRPPCLPGGKHGEIQTCLRGQEGLYCPPCRLKFKYPPFSENIDFMPSSIQPPCWWKTPPSCEAYVDDGTLQTITRRWECAYDSTEWPSN